MAPVDDGGGGLPRTLPSVGDHIEVDRDVLRDVAKRLHADLQDIKGWGSGSLNDLQNNSQGLVTADDLGQYPAGQAISQTFQQAYDQIGSVYQQFVTSYEQVIQAIQRSADNYQSAEDATAASAHQVQTQTSGGQW